MSLKMLSSSGDLLRSLIWKEAICGCHIRICGTGPFSSGTPIVRNQVEEGTHKLPAGASTFVVIPLDTLCQCVTNNSPTLNES